MGYDMYLREVPAHLRDQWQEYKELRDRWLQLERRPRGDPEREAAWAALMAHKDPAYLCVNIDGMAALRQIMRAAGMLVDAPEPGPGWLVVVPTRSLGQDARGEEIRQLDYDSPEYRELMGQLRYRPEGSVGIAWWKLCSNDGWLVTAEECAEALAAWESLDPKEQRALVTEYIYGACGDHTYDRAVLAVVSAESGIPVEQLSLGFGQPDDTFWPDWLAWLRLAADSAGFSVW